MTSELMIEEPSDGVMLLTLDRPARRNALDLALTDALADALARFEDEDRWRAAVLTGRPPAFCAGLDLKAFSAPDAPRERVSALIASIPALSKPIVAAVNGAAYTGGLEIVLACDFALAGESARFADTPLKIGALSGSGMGARLPHAVGLRFAKQMIYAGEPVDVATALRVGLVNEVVPDDRLLARALELAAAVAGHDPALVRIVKGVLDGGARPAVDPALAIERQALADRKTKGDMRWTADQ